MTLDPAEFDALTFDCYGTLIDWEAGIVAALRDALGEGATSDEEALLERYARVESGLQAGPYRSYRDILAAVVRELAGQLHVPLTQEAVQKFAGSVVDWPAFPDSGESLRALATRFRLVIVSNVDDDLFAGSAARLGVDFHEVVTAQQVRRYKPAHDHFHEALRRLDLPKERVLHVAQSLFHDHAPAKELGFTTLWVNRRAGREGGGATAPATAAPDHEVRDMAAAARLLGV